MSLGLDACEVRLCPPCVRMCVLVSRMCQKSHTDTHIHIHTSTSHTKAGLTRGAVEKGDMPMVSPVCVPAPPAPPVSF